MSDWTWEFDPDDLLDGLPPKAAAEVEEIARELAVRESLCFPDGVGHTGGTPGLRNVRRPLLMVFYLTDVRRERVVVVRVILLG